MPPKRGRRTEVTPAAPKDDDATPVVTSSRRSGTKTPRPSAKREEDRAMQKARVGKDEDDVPQIVDEPHEEPANNGSHWMDDDAPAAPLPQDVLLDSDSDDSDVVLFPGGFGEDTMQFTAEGRRLLRLGNQQPADDESDSSEDEAVINRVGDIPLEWYADEDHVGYDVDGNKILKPSKSALDQLLEATDDANALRTIIDPMTGEKKILTNRDLQLIFNLQRNRAPNPDYDAMYDDYEKPETEFDPLNHPLARGAGPSKTTFVPRLHEMKRLQKMITKMLKAQEEGKDPTTIFDKPKKEESDEPYVIWDDTNVEMDTKTKFRYIHKIDKPRVVPPGTYESYRPPPEYLPSEMAKKKFERTRKIDRKEHFQPQQFGALRHVPFYNHFIQDRYQRCLDLAFFPRMTRTRIVVDPEKLLPDLPNPRDLKPYPERLSFLYKGHTGTVRCISVSPNGQYLATCCDDHMVRVFEVQTGRLMKRYDVGGVPQQVAFSPSKTMNVLAVSVEFALLFIVPPFAAHRTVNEHTMRYLRAPGSATHIHTKDAVGAGLESGGGHGITQAAIDVDETAYELDKDLDDHVEKEKRAEFVDGNSRERSAGIVVKVVMHARVKRFTFHRKGDYLCALCPKDHVKYRQTIMLQLSTRKVFCPFRKFGDIVTDCVFHPSEPLFFLATTNSIRCYNLLQHRLTKKYKAQGGLTTCISMHPSGDNFLVGDTTHHTSWYDCDLSDKPYRRMKSHKGVVNDVGFHPNTDAYPLFASASSDGQVHVFHGMVYDDYNKNALIVPVKILKHTRPVYALAWHPTLPWLFTSTEDGTVSCWTE
jgi:ribosome biogenesis protein ERB1